MATTEHQLRTALSDFMRAASKRGDVSGALKRISELQAQLGNDAHPMLRHYLERRSYQKALDLLDSGHPETETPQCGKEEKDEG
jgi:hypothetical protein